jgi:hypothetical protein
MCKLRPRSSYRRLARRGLGSNERERTRSLLSPYTRKKLMLHSNALVRAFLLPTALAVGLAVSPVPERAHADHGDPAADSIEALVDDFALRLDELAIEFGIDRGELPTFDDAEFNRLVRRARNTLDRSIRRVDEGHVCRGVSELARVVLLLEAAVDRGVEVNMSGWGHADDLASLASFRAEVFLEDLIVLAAREGADGDALEAAAHAEALGDFLRQSGEWAQATDAFATGACLLL